MSNSSNLNDWFVTDGAFPTNFVVTTDIDHFPKIKRLRELKQAAIESSRLHDPLHIKADLRTLDLWSALQTQFETIIIDPPWYEYYARVGGFPPACEAEHNESVAPWWSFEDIRSLRIEEISANPGFCFIWCGSKHVEQATACLLKWGYRRIEDICWLKTNEETKNTVPDFLPFGSRNALRMTKEHLLVGIKGTVHRSRDSHLIHANIDSDVVIAPQEGSVGCTRKPSEIYEVIERFCNSQRRLELFGHDHNLRPGWVTIGSGISQESNYDAIQYSLITAGDNRFVKSNHEIDRLRPKSPRRSLGN